MSPADAVRWAANQAALGLLAEADGPEAAAIRWAAARVKENLLFDAGRIEAGQVTITPPERPIPR